jgi:hypothetical protein
VNARWITLSLTALGLAATLLAAQQGGGVTCADGSKSTASGRGACSGHGGVAKQAAAEAKNEVKAEARAEKKDDKQLAKAEKKEAKAERKEKKRANPEGATARCKDGTYSHAKSAQGACGKHGGVAEVLKKG